MIQYLVIKNDGLIKAIFLHNLTLPASQVWIFFIPETICYNALLINTYLEMWCF
jgi:hypothetical protein